MSKLNISRNIFLEKEELNRFQDFLLNDTIASIFLENSSSWGIIRTIFSGPSPDYLVEVGTNLGTIKIDSLSKAVDVDRLLILQKPIDNISVPQDNSWYWVKISHKYSPLEEGECSINANGEVTGLNTKFSEVLRGHSSEVPVKIKFYKDGGAINNQIYEVLSLNTVTPDLNLILVGNEFQPESGLRYYVIGSTPIFEVITSQQEEGLYFYDGCNIELILEEVEDTPPVSNFIEDKQFYIARVRNSAGSITIQDKRTDWWTFNIEGISDKLDKYANLSDLTDVAQARANLGVSSTQELEEAYFHDTGWQNMNSGSAAASTNFSIKIRRFGNFTTITGKFNTGSSITPGAMVASIPYITIGVEARPSTDIYFTAGDISNLDRNRGMRMYVKAYTQGDTFLGIYVLNADESVQNMSFTVTYVNQ